MKDDCGATEPSGEIEAPGKPAEVIDTHIASIYLGEDGIIRVALSSPDDYTVDHAREHIDAYERLGAGVKLPVLVDIRGMTKLPPRDVRQYYASPQGIQYTAAAAVLVESDLTKVMANFFFRFHNPSHPIKLFTDEAEAVAWLKGYSP